MDYRIIERDGRMYVEMRGGAFLKSEQDAVEMVGICGEAGTSRLMLRESNLSSDFFDLRTGLAGAALLKWSNYRLRVAAVISIERIGRGKFYEFALETNRGRQFFIAQDVQAAEEWLLKE